LREKTFTNFAVLWLHVYAKVFSAKFGAWRHLVLQKRAIRESFLRENRIFTILRKFSPSKVSCYTVFYVRVQCMLLFLVLAENSARISRRYTLLLKSPILMQSLCMRSLIPRLHLGILVYESLGTTQHPHNLAQLV